MPRPTPHSFARQLALQVVMWGLFVASLIGAWLLTRNRDSALRLGPLDAPHQLGLLNICIPHGWEPQAQPLLNGVQLIVREPSSSRIHRVLVITQEQFDGPMDEASIADQLDHPDIIESVEFQNLHVTGQMAQGTFEDQRSGAITQKYEAFVILPNSLAVKVEMRNVPGFTDIDRENFLKILDALEPAAEGASAKPHHPMGPLVPIGDWRRFR